MKCTVSISYSRLIQGFILNGHLLVYKSHATIYFHTMNLLRLKLQCNHTEFNIQVSADCQKQSSFSKFCKTGNFQTFANTLICCHGHFHYVSSIDEFKLVNPMKIINVSCNLTIQFLLSMWLTVNFPIAIGLSTNGQVFYVTSPLRNMPRREKLLPKSWHTIQQKSR